MDLTPDQAALAVERHNCPNCDAPAGSACRTRGGKTAAMYHTPRFVLVPALREELEIPVPADRHPGRVWKQGPALAVVPAPCTERPVRIGYARTSTARQELASQLEALHRAECHKVFTEQIRADAALLHRPFDDTSGFDTEDLHTEGQVAILPAGHPLGVRPHVRLAEVTGLPDLPLPRWPRPDGTFADGPGPQVRDHTQLTQLIALGRACAVVPESGRTGLREDLTAVPVLDAPHVTTVIAWPAHSRSTVVAGLVRAATAL
ncbi:LysR substrate-binding domain-containing protein [Streptomyces sp. NBC_01589]|uniref:zinc finger domain-containing protein n=1 Tax=unclassified Streptomyces TaxID=2593676 RepID=UPI00386E6E53